MGEGSGKEKNSGEGIAIRLLVHRASVGAVIGKGGTTIKETQSETNVRVQVSNEPLPNSTEKTSICLCSGSADVSIPASIRLTVYAAATSWIAATALSILWRNGQRFPV